MHFQLLLIVTGILIIALFSLLSIVLSYLSIARKFRFIKLKVKNKAVNISDMGLSILTSVDQKSLEPEFLQLKTKFWSDYKKDLRIFWESAHALIDFLEKYESQIPQKSDLHLKFKRVHHELYEAVHEYNLEVLLIENRLQKRFFRLINTLFLNIDSNQLHHLHEY